MKPNFKIITILAAAMLVGMLGGVGYMVLHPNKVLPIYPLLLVDRHCQLDQHTECVARDPVGLHEVSLKLTPKPIPVMETVQALLHLQGFADPTEIQLMVEGVEMFMGYQYATFQPIKDNWQGEFFLPLCTSQVMRWQAQLDIYTPTAIYRAHFPFATFSSKTAPTLQPWLLEK